MSYWMIEKESGKCRTMASQKSGCDGHCDLRVCCRIPALRPWRSRSGCDRFWPALRLRRHLRFCHHAYAKVEPSFSKFAIAQSGFTSESDVFDAAGSMHQVQDGSFFKISRLCTGGGDLADLHEYDPPTRRWTDLSGTATGPHYIQLSCRS